MRCWCAIAATVVVSTSCLDHSPFQAPYLALAYSDGDTRDLTIDGAHIYWTTQSGVERVQKDGTGHQTIAEDNQNAGTLGALVVDESRVYWISTGRNTPGAPNNQIWSASKEGGEATPMAFSTNVLFESNLVADDTFLYYVANTEAGGLWSIVKLAKDDSSAISVYSPANGAARHLALSGNRLYATGCEDLWRVDTDPAATVIPLHDAMVGPVAADDTHVYWWENAVGAIRRVTTGGGSPETLAAEPECTSQIVLDDTHIYWLVGSGFDNDEERSMIRKVRKSGGPSATLVEFSDHSFGGDFGGGGEACGGSCFDRGRTIAVDETHIYWSTGDTIFKFTK